MAKRDIAGCADFILERSMDPDIPLLWEDSLLEHLEQLETFPNSYPIHEGNYRKLLHGRYITIFRVDETLYEVTVCRIIHSARRIDNAGPIEI